MSKIIPFPVPGSRSGVCQADIEEAVAEGVQRYFDACHEAVPGFIDRHFNYPGALATNRVAIGWDMLRAPANLFWAPVYALACLIKWPFSEQGRFGGLVRMLDRVPAGFTTEVQQHITGLIADELLNPGATDCLLEDYIIDSLQQSYEQHAGTTIGRQQFQRLIEPLLDDALRQYQVTRTASADIANSLTCTIMGAFAFQKFTPGGIGIGLLLASMLAKSMATREFVLGETLGRVYYGFFPPEPTLGMILTSTTAVMVMLATIAALSGMIIDPLQAALGIHRRRLHKMLDHLQQDFMASTYSNSYRPKDQFVARIMDTFDMIKSGII